jgi:hypothetical protein
MLPDDAPIDLAQALVIDAEPRLYIGAKVLDHDIGFLSHTPEDIPALGIFQIERHRALVAVQILEVGTVARAARLLSGGVLRQRIDLDDIRSPVRQLPHAGRSGPDAGQVENGKAGKGLRGTMEGH